MIDQKRKTSTITIHHDRCDISKWTLAEWRTLAAFVKDGSLQHAAALSRLGMQLVLSEHHEPAGGALEHFGWSREHELQDFVPTDELHEAVEDDLEVTPIVQIYRGPTKYAVRYATGDEDGNVDGHEFEIKDSEADARDFIKSLVEHEPA